MRTLRRVLSWGVVIAALVTEVCYVLDPPHYRHWWAVAIFAWPVIAVITTRLTLPETMYLVIGYPARCSSCGREVMLRTEPPEGETTLCTDCQN